LSLYVSTVLYNGYETWSVILREEYKPRVFENRMLRGIFEPERDKIIESLRKLHYEELHTLYFLPISIRIIKPWIGWGRNVARLERRTVDRTFW
jgi:hypothetical protein